MPSPGQLHSRKADRNNMIAEPADTVLSFAQEGESKPAVAAPLSARVLDVSKADGVVDLSAAPALLPLAGTDAGKRARKEPRADKWKVRSAGDVGALLGGEAAAPQVAVTHWKVAVRQIWIPHQSWA
jgi:hypothetical protein